MHSMKSGWVRDEIDPSLERWWNDGTATALTRAVDAPPEIAASPALHRAESPVGFAPPPQMPIGLGDADSSPTTIRPTLTPPPENPTAPGGRSQRRWLIPATIGALGLIVVGIVVGILLTRTDTDPTTGSAATGHPDSTVPVLGGVDADVTPPTIDTSETTPSVLVLPSVHTEPPQTAATTPPTAPDTRRFPATVRRTCGSAGTGDCYVTLRQGPSSSTQQLGRRDEGNVLDVVCQVSGESVRSSILGSPTSVWIRGADGSYASGAFIDVAGWDPFTISEPC